MKFERKYIVGVRDISIDKKMTNLAILGLLEEVASMHSNDVGYGVYDIGVKKKVWLLMDWQLQVIDRPKYNENLTIKTWARPIRKHYFYTYRDFEIYIGEKRTVIATSKWVFFDLNTNKISKIPDDVLGLYKPEVVQVFNESEISKIGEPEKYDYNNRYEVLRSDIDINKHMHNLNYLKYAYEILPEEIFENGDFKNVKIRYKHQVLLGDKINCNYTNQDGKNIIAIKNEDNSVLHAIVELN